MIMVTYGYPTGDTINPTKLITPPIHELDKIHLLPSRPYFIVTGTRDSIFDWMEYNENVVCEFDREFHFITTTKPLSKRSALKITSRNLIVSFELYNDKDSIVKRLLKFNGLSKMRLEIKVNYNGTSPSTSSTSPPVMIAKGASGIRLRHVLDAWRSNRDKLARVACDYE